MTPSERLAERGVRRVALFGTRSVVESDLYGQLTAFTVVRPKPPEIDVIHDTYMDVVTLGRGTERHRATLQRLAHTLIERDAVDAIVLAGTELPLVFGGGNFDFTVVDCAAAHTVGIMRRASS